MVSTPVLRDQYGTSLAAAVAPLAVAGFGSRAARVDVRVTAPGGAAFKSQLAAEHAFLTSSGTLSQAAAGGAQTRFGGTAPRPRPATQRSVARH